jgi:thiosulfate/3-mercaptopyruvate sulfurtransferase
MPIDPGKSSPVAGSVSIWRMASAVELLVDVKELEQVRALARVVDVRWKLGEPAAGRELFLDGHIPGAVYVDMDADLAEAPGLGGRHPVPSAVHFAAAMSRAGVGDDTWVIAYDDGGSGAPRLWWLLRHFGHTRVSILDGGYPAWLAVGGQPETGEGVTPPIAQFTARSQEGDVMDVEALQQALADGGVHLLDARAPERWRGEVEPVDRVAGRIPGAINAPAGDQVQAGFFRTPEELRDYYSALGVLDGKPIVVSCGSGVSACVDLVAMELAGISGAQLCPGSFSGWIAHGLPVRTGPE